MRVGSKGPCASGGGGLHPLRMNPRTEGPRITPIPISPMIVGWRNRLLAKWLATATERRIVSWRNTSDSVAIARGMAQAAINHRLHPARPPGRQVLLAAPCSRAWGAHGGEDYPVGHQGGRGRPRGPPGPAPGGGALRVREPQGGEVARRDRGLPRDPRGRRRAADHDAPAGRGQPEDPP